MRKKIGLSLFSLVIILALFEITLRYLNFPPQLNKSYQRRDIEWMEKNVQLNSYGYRDKEYSQNAAPDTLRIYALGDSYTYGWLVDNPQDSYPNILEQELSDQGKKIEVINAGNPGYSLNEMLARFKNEGKDFYPNLVLVGINDDEANVSKTYQQPADVNLNKLIRSLYIYQISLGNYFRIKAEKANHDFVLNIYTDKNSSEWQKFAEQLLLLKEEINKINSTLAIILFPHIHPNTPNGSYDYSVFNEKLEQFGKQNGITIIDPLEDFINYKDKSRLVINPLDPHPTPEMNKIIARSFIKQFDVNKFMQTNQPVTGQPKSVTLNLGNLNLGQFQKIKNITTRMDGLPWVYFETKYDKSVQNFPLRDKSFRNSKIYLDSLTTAKSFTHSGLPGATITYHIYPKNPGEISIPGKVYNFEVIGINHIYAMEILSDGSTRGNYIPPSEVVKNNESLKIKFENNVNYHVFRVNLKVAVKQLDISPEGRIENITKTYLLRTVQPENNFKVILPFEEKISSMAEFSESENKTYTYAFVNGKITQVKEIKMEDAKIILTFNSSVQKDSQIEFPVMANYPFGEGENLIAEIE